MNWLPTAIIKYFTGAQPESVFQPTPNGNSFNRIFSVITAVLVIIFSSIILSKWQ